MCESDVTVKYNNTQEKFEEVIQLHIKGNSLTIVSIGGKRKTFTGFNGISFLNANFLSHKIEIELFGEVNVT
ncbi:MAG: CooT family nickel-binding protein [Thermofilum sp.]|jgi:predicted RNA-binding protein|uniref:CooT family nickel-binding protein n=1 Tax=Thermofilum sp. TaxID=1961369 RepID=UPI0025867912|nr:CooT family nickel-binding protein [Thermofilum sp.]MCI4409920.1 CooT family nickel-binding protein [Thermofilum sp.]